MCICFFFFQAEDGIRDLVRSRGLGDVYKRQVENEAGRVLDGGRNRGRAAVHRQLAHPLGSAGALSLIHI